jgi:hypothetical protein
MGRTPGLRALTLLLLLLLASAAAAQRPAAPAEARLPPLSMTCPMHPDIVESRPGSCPLCKMALVPVRLDSAWMCPIHTTVMSDEEGTCRICRRQLMQVRVAVTWTCLAQPGIERMEPGSCPDGSAMIVRRTLRPHGNHNPQHGGQFFMAPDNWHHLEGTYPRDRVFRLYVYDDYARTLPAADMKRVQARVVTRETFDAATRKTTEITSFPLRLSGGGAYFEARIDAVKLPAEMTAKVTIKPGAPEHRFDFTFQRITREPASPAAAAGRTPATAGATTATPARPATSPANRPAAAGASAPSAAAATASGQPTAAGTASNSTTAGAATEPLPGGDPLLAPLQIPGTMEGIVEQLKARDAAIGELIRQGNFAAVWVPAFHAKDLAIALEPHLAHLPPDARELGEPALQRVVRFAWLLDAFGDVGNRQQLEGGHAELAAAIADVVKAFAEVQ